MIIDWPHLLHKEVAELGERGVARQSGLDDVQQTAVEFHNFLNVRKDFLDLVGRENFGGLAQVALELVKQTLLITVAVNTI